MDSKLFSRRSINIIILCFFRPLGSGGKALGPGASGSSVIRAPPAPRPPPPPTKVMAPPPTKPPTTSKFISISFGLMLILICFQ
jgi:hypothetical protein